MSLECPPPPGGKGPKTRVRVDRRHADRREVVREVAPRVELAVLGAVAAAFLVGGAPGEVTEEAGPAGGYA